MLGSCNYGNGHPLSMWSGRRATKSRLRWRFRYQTSSEGVHGFGGFMPVRARTAGEGAGGSGPSCAGRHSHQPMTRRAGIHTPIRENMQPSRAKPRSATHNSAAPRERPAGQASPDPPTRVRGAPSNTSRIALRRFSVHAVHDHRPHGVAAGRGGHGGSVGHIMRCGVTHPISATYLSASTE